jgi:hypothetical protein
MFFDKLADLGRIALIGVLTDGTFSVIPAGQASAHTALQDVDAGRPPV